MESHRRKKRDSGKKEKNFLEQGKGISQKRNTG